MIVYISVKGGGSKGVLQVSTIDTDPNQEKTIPSPTGDGTMYNQHDVLMYLNAHPELRKQAGYEDVALLPLSDGVMTVWDAIVKQVNGALADADAKSMGLR